MEGGFRRKILQQEQSKDSKETDHGIEIEMKNCKALDIEEEANTHEAKTEGGDHRKKTREDNEQEVEKGKSTIAK